MSAIVDLTGENPENESNSELKTSQDEKLEDEISSEQVS